MFDYIYIFLVLISPFIGKLIKNIYLIYKLKKEYVKSTDILNYMQSLTNLQFGPVTFYIIITSVILLLVQTLNVIHKI